MFVDNYAIILINVIHLYCWYGKHVAYIINVGFLLWHLPLIPYATKTYVNLVG